MLCSWLLSFPMPTWPLSIQQMGKAGCHTPWSSQTTLYSEQTLGWPWYRENQHSLPVSDASWCVLVTSHHQQFRTLWSQCCTVLAMLFPVSPYPFILSLLNCKSMTPNCPLYLKRSSLFPFFCDQPFILSFPCLLKSFSPFRNCFIFVRFECPCYGEKNPKYSSSDCWQDATSGKFHAWPPATGCRQKAGCTNNKKYHMKLPPGYVSKVHMKQKWTLCLDLETITWYLIYM